MIDSTQARAILEEFGVTVVPASAHPQPGQTKAVANLQKIVRLRGHEHARFLIMTWQETMIKKTIMDASTMWAVSDVIIAVERNYPDLMSNKVEDWFAFFDALQVGWLQDWARDLDGIVPKRFAIAGQIYERIKRLYGMSQGDLLDDRARRTA